MKSPSPSLEDLAKRVAQLERERRYTRAIGLLILLGAVALPAAFATPVDGVKSILAERFIFTDKEGKQRGMLGVENDGSPVLIFSDRQGKQRLVLGVRAQEEYPTISLLDQDEKDRVNLMITPQKHPALYFLSAEEQTRLLLQTQPDGSPSLCLCDPKGDAQCILQTLPDGSSGLSFYDDEQEVKFRSGRLNMGLSPKGIPSLRFLRKDGTVQSDLPNP
ncbi:hypothetical protein [Singulisphaera sp. PoT]|uniref:hypothetical protein n=1 Tax=Singulisphaera sp. PoT TaxID=3411797 RepID=UPI003BF5FC6B